MRQVLHWVMAVMDAVVVMAHEDNIIIIVINIVLLALYFIIFLWDKRVSNKNKVILFFMTILLFCNNAYYGFSIPFILLTCYVLALGGWTFFIKDKRTFKRFFRLYTMMPILMSMKAFLEFFNIR